MKKKSLICMFLLGLLCSFNVKAQVISGAQVISVTFPQSVNYFTSLSDNGLWATVGGTDPENTTIYAYPYLCNAQTGELIELWEGDNVVGIANDVTNDGKIVVGVYNNGPAYYDVDQKKWIQLEGKGIPTCITPDGKRIAGYYMGGDDGSGQGQSNEYPVVWDLEDGKYVFHEVSGKNGLYAETFPNRDKNNNLTQMFRIENMSADGKILAGAINFVYVNDACYYVFNTETGETKYVDNLCFDSPSGGHIDFSNMSNNGAYLTGNAWVIQGDEYTSAYRMDIANGTAELYNTYADEQDRAGQAVSNTGTVFASSPAVNVVRYMYIKHGKLWLGLDEIMQGRYGINIYDKINQETTGYAVDVSDDEKVLLAMSAPTATGYIIRLPETFSESASHIDPFDSYTVDPASGSSFARFRQGTITFAKPTTIKSGATGKLLDKNGGVFSTVNITPNSDGVSFNLSALPKLFTPGEEYTLVLPAGTFSLSADDSYQNSEIRLTYIGREDTPVRVLQVDPADGANVSEISTNQMVRIGFDMNVKVNTDEEGNAMVGYLYEADGTSPLCELVLSVNQNTLGMAPALRRYLRKDIDYRVVLPADAVTDMMGDCGNEEITINYHGLYEAGPTPTGDLFSDDFNDPSVSMATYLLYEGDHNRPASMPAGWGFDADNNPWNFTLRDDEQSDDYFAASHSMYNPADQSDDWMSLPQLQIDNADYYLSFNAQKYLSNKHDVLKVYVLAAEEGYTTFTDELKQRFLTEGDLVFDQELSFGQSQDRISTDWTEDTQFEIPLADYSGKSIYIAFVNQNNANFDTALGFHGLEFVLFRDGAPRKASVFDGNEDHPSFANKPAVKCADELAFLVAVAGDVRDNCYRLEVSWLGLQAPTAHQARVRELGVKTHALDNNGYFYGADMLLAGTDGSSYASINAALVTIVGASGCGNIANEVASQKIGQAYRVATGAPSLDPNEPDAIDYIESPYSKRSYIDYRDNIYSIKNSLYGNIDQAQPEAKSVMTFLRDNGYDGAEELQAALDDAIAKLTTCVNSGIAFVDAPGHQQAGAAMEAVDALNDQLNAAAQWIEKQ